MPEAETLPDVPLWRRALPVVVGVALVAWVVSRLDVAAFFSAVRRTNYVAFTAFTVVFNLALLSADSFATTYVYRRTLAPVKYRELFVIRGASYLPSMLNHHVGQAWLTYFLSRAYRAPLGRAAGATLLVYATTFGALFLFLLAGLPANHGTVPWLLPTVAVIGAGAVVYAAVIVAAPPVLARRPLIAPLFDVGLRGHLVALVHRLPHVTVQFAGAWVPFLLFGVHVPFSDALTLIPVLMFVVTLPVSPQGLGTRDAMSIALLARYAEGSDAERAAAIAATTLSWLVVVTLVQLVLSLAFMKRAHELLGQGTRIGTTPSIP